MKRAAIVLILALTFAGCLGSGSGGGSGKTSSSSTTTTTSSSSSTTTGPPPFTPVLDLLLDFDLAPCRGLSIQVARPIADVQALLPSGFTAAVAPFAPVDGAGILAVDLYACENLTTPKTAVPQTFYGQVYTLIEHPAERVPDAPEADLQEYVFRVLAGTDILAILWPAAGYDTYNGTVTYDAGPLADLPIDLGARVAQASVGEAGYLLTAAANANPVLPTPASGTFARYTALADGSVLVWTGRYDLPAPTGGQGVLQVPAGDPFANLALPGGNFQGLARVYDDGGLLEMDLRRVFTAPPG